MNQEKLKEAIEFARANGLKSIEVDGIKMEVLPLQQTIEVNLQTDDELKRAFANDPFEDMTEEEILFYSTPYFQELQEKKKQKQDALLSEQQVRDEVANGKDDIS